MNVKTRIVEAVRTACLGLALAAISGLLASSVAAAAQDTPVLADQKQKMSYAMGMVLGKQLRGHAVEMDVDLYMRGLTDALAGGRTLMTDTEARLAVDMLQRELKPRPAPADAAPVPSRIDLSFKLDSRLTRGMYMGDRWVSPPVFMSVLDAKEAVVLIRANVVDPQGKAMKIVPEWVPEDPAMVTVVSGEEGEIKLTVKRAGESRVKVTVPGVSRDLSIKAVAHEEALKVEIAQ